jgi:hypothetical protein
MTNFLQFEDNETEYALISDVMESTIIMHVTNAIQVAQKGDTKALRVVFDALKPLLQGSLTSIQELIMFELLRRAVVMPPSSHPLDIRVARDREFRCSIRVISVEAATLRGVPKCVCTFKAQPVVYETHLLLRAVTAIYSQV